MPDYRSPEAEAYRYLYKSSAWRKGRIAFLAQHRWCVRCKRIGKWTPATVVHHMREHKGNLELFFSVSNWEPLCKPCHDGPAQQVERRGYENTIGPDGWPIDPRHPANR